MEPRNLCVALLVFGGIAAKVAAAATVQGTVIAADTLQPLAGATVYVGSDCPGNSPCRSNAYVVTAADGSFRATNMRTGLAYLLARFLPGQQNYAKAESSFVVADGINTIDVQLQPGASISGTVENDSDHAGLAGVTVSVEAVALYGANAGAATTGPDGRYTVAQLAPGDYTVTSDGGACCRAEYYAGHTISWTGNNPPADVVTLDAAQARDGVDFSLPLAGSIHGTLIDRHSSLPIANTLDVVFYLYDSSGNFLSDLVTVSDAQGRYRWDGLPAGSYRISAQTDNYSTSYLGCAPDPCSSPLAGTLLEVVPGTIATADFPLFPHALISGRVTRRSDGQPLAGVSISSSQLGASYEETRTDSDGNYVLNAFSGNIIASVHSGVPAYRDQIYADHNCITTIDCNVAADHVTTSPYQITEHIDFHLDAAAAIGGRVVAEDTQAGIAARILLYGTDGSLFGDIDGASDGTFRTHGLPPGNYFLAAAAPYLSGYDCAFYGDVPCECDFGICQFALFADPHALAIMVGAQDVNGIVISLRREIVFANGFE